jgi:hypothetical protein
LANGLTGQLYAPVQSLPGALANATVWPANAKEAIAMSGAAKTTSAFALRVFHEVVMTGTVGGASNRPATGD